MEGENPLKLTPINLSRKGRIILGAVVLVLGSAAVAFLSWFSYYELFPGNARFTLRHVEVNSRGWWKGKSAYIAAIADLKPGSTGLFQLNLPEIRSRLLQEPSIENLIVARKLPDTLSFTITERIPRALLGNPKSPFVLDSSGVVIHRDKCVKIDGNLPVIQYFREPIPAFGSRFDRLKPSVDLIMLTITDFPEIRIGSINAANTDYLLFSMYYQNDFTRLYRVYLPVKDMKAGLTHLMAAMPSVLRPGETRTTIDLRYEGRVTLK